MPQLNKSETVRQRLRYLLERLIAFANHELTDCEHLESKISVRWKDLETSTPQLIVKTEIRFLAALVSPTPSPKVKEHLKQDLRTLKDFLGRLEDNRDRTQGTGLWHFTLKLWHRSSDKNLIAFDELWQQRKAATQKVTPKKTTHSAATLPATSPPSLSAKVDQPPVTSPPSQNVFVQAASPQVSAATSVADRLPHHNLPARDYGTFIGREQTLEQLMSFLKSAHPVSRISLTGIGGIGKTALALEVAHRCLRDHQASSAQIPTVQNPDDLFSALVFVSAKQQRLTPQGILPSYRYSRTLQDIFRAIAQTLKRSDLLTGDFEHQLESTYELLSWQRTLLILDNLESLQAKEQQAVLSFLYEVPTTVKAIVTSREHLTMDAIMPLQALPEPEGLQFIAHQAALKSLSLSETATSSLYTQTGGVPAAVVYALGQVAAGYAMPAVLPKLTLQANDYCRYYLQSTIESLRGQSSYDVLLALALFPSIAPVQALTYIAQLTDATAAESFATLQQLALVTPVVGDDKCFSILPLTREYFLSQQSDSSQLEARERWLQWHQQWLSRYSHVSWREWHDYAPIDAFWENVQAAVEWCILSGRDQDFSLLWRALRGYTHLRGYWNERLAWLTWWLEAAQQKEDSLTMMKALRDLGWTLTLMGQPEQLETANGYFAEAWKYRDEAEIAFQLDLAIESAILCLFQNRLVDVQPWLTTAESLLSKASLTVDAAAQQRMRLSYYTAQLYYRQGDYPAAKALYQTLLNEATVVSEMTSTGALGSAPLAGDSSEGVSLRRGMQQAEVYILNWLVDIALQQSDLDEAQRLLAQNLPMIEHWKDMRSQAFHLRSQAKLDKLRGNLAEFERWSQQAKACFERLGMQPQAQEMQAWLTEMPD